MNNERLKYERLEMLRKAQIDLHERILQELKEESADVLHLYREYDIENSRLIAEISAILNSIDKNNNG